LGSAMDMCLLKFLAGISCTLKRKNISFLITVINFYTPNTLTIRLLSKW